MLTRHNYLWYLQEVTKRAKQKLSKKKETQSGNKRKIIKIVNYFLHNKREKKK